MQKLCSALFLIVFVKTLPAQIPEFQWARHFTANNQWNYDVHSNGRSVAVDQQGNVYSAGLFEYTTDFDPGPGVFNLTATTRADEDLYISKLSPTGDFLWAIQIGTWVEFGNIEIAVDKNDNVYITSELREPADMDPGPGVFMLTPIGPLDAFVAKYDPNGNLVWAKQFGGPGDTVPRGDVITIDANGDVIVCGNFNRTVDFDPGPGTFNMTSTAHIQSFVVKLDNNGNFVWAKQHGNSPVVYSNSSISDVVCDNLGNIYTVGNFAGTCDFDPGPDSFKLRAASFNDGYVAKWTASGQFVWAKRIGNNDNDYYDFAKSWGIALDQNNNVYTVGHFTGNFDFDPGPGSFVITSNNYDWYVLKLDAAGNFVWVAAMGGSMNDMAFDVAVDLSGNVYSIGSAGQSADMDPGPGDHVVTTQGQYGATILSKLNPQGQFVYAVPFDGNGSCYVKRLLVDNSSNIYFTGYMYGTIDYDPGLPVYSLSSYGYAPMVVKLGKCKNPTSSTLTIAACSSYILNNELFDSTGTYYRTIPNSTGCDSLITLHLTINKKFTQQSISICEGTSFFAGGADQVTAGTYVDTLQSSIGCDSIVTTILNIYAAPRPNLGADIDICSGTNAVLTPGSFTSYTWQDGSTGASFAADRAGTYFVRVSDQRNCTGHDTIQIKSLLPLPAAFLPADTAVCSYGKVAIKPTSAYRDYLWSSGGNSSSIVVTTAGTYWLEVTDSKGCVGRDSIIVARKECLTGFYMPNAFTPDKNGRNDELKPIIGGVVIQYQFSVYNRWGQLVFTSKDPGKGWDGLVAGKPQGNDAFAWVCSFQLEGQPVQVERGTALLIR